MRCNPSYWLLGLVPVAMLSWVAVQLEREGIEADLGRRTQEALSRAGLDWAVPVFSGRDGVVTGKATADTDPAKALGSVRDTWGVRIAQGRTELLELVDRFTWSATSEAKGKLVVAGFVPSEDARKQVLTAARGAFAKTEIIDEMKLARGAPDRDAWVSGALFGLKQLAQLKTGTAGLDGLDLSLVGAAATIPAYKSVKSALSSSVPAGVALAFEKIMPPSVGTYTWTAKSSGKEVLITGFVPSEKAREGVGATVRKVLPKSALTDRTDVADGAPDNWADAANAALVQLGALKSGTADIKGKDLTFLGEAANEATANAVRTALKSSVPQAFKINEQIKYPRAAAPLPTGGYVMSIAHDGSTLEVSGYVPSEAARAALIDAVKARFPGQTVTDRLQIVTGAPDGWQQCIVAGLAALPRLATGQTILADRKLSVTGTTNDYAIAQGVPSDVKAAAGQTCEASTDIAFTGEFRNDLSWSAAHEENGAVVLSGEVPDETSRGRITESAQRMFQRAKITDQMKIAGAPAEPWLTVALRGLDQLARLKSGQVTLAAKDLTVRGVATSEAIAAGVRSAIGSGLPEGFKGSDAIQVVVPDPRQQEADRCQELMRDATEKGILQFARAKADLTDDSTDTLKELAEIANACPGFRIEIEGHTDGEGTDDRNQRLSDRRASAVADFLTRSGVDRGRLSTIGYGATRPLADNITEDGRAKNRRIEFTVKVN